MNMLNNFLVKRLAAHQQSALYRSRIQLESAQGVEVVYNNKPALSFCSNDYLGLVNHPEVVAAFKQAANVYGIGSGASHLLGGHHQLHHELEEKLAAFIGCGRVLLFSTGYMANLGVITSLIGKGDVIFADKLNHASLMDASRFCGAQLQRYRHLSMQDLENRLLISSQDRKFIISDGVFSVDGDIAPLVDLVAMSKKFNACLMIDDAHGFGVLGRSGKGSLEHFSLSAAEVPVLIGTLGKSFGTAGAFVAGSHALIEYLIQFARSYIYTTALPPAIAAATCKSLELLEKEQWRRKRLIDLMAYFQSAAKQSGLVVMPSVTPIQLISLPNADLAIKVHQKLLESGIVVGMLRPPTVPPNCVRLRITLSALHSEQQIDRLVETLSSLDIYEF